MTNKIKFRNRRLLTFVFCLIVSLSSSFVHSSTDNLVIAETQQRSTIEGYVLDSKGEPIIGATVLEKGTSNGTITDLTGKFVLKISQGTAIVVSYIGYASVELKAMPNMKIQLKEDTELLDEVVVVGFGSQKKVNLTGAVATADSKQLESRPVVNATQALQGLVPGLQITQNGGSLGSRPSINVRGATTIGDGSNGNPLILIDGMEGDLNAINPQDIENISVLKDASASSIYGSRAPFGVILVTTKSGKEGRISVNYNTNIRLSAPIKRPKIMDSYTFATYFNDALVNAGAGAFFTPEWLQRIKDYQNGSLTTSVPVNPNNSQYWMDGYVGGNDNVDWYKEIYKDWSFSQEHNFSANGGSEKMKYYVSANYLDQNGLMKIAKEAYQRYNTTAKINAQLSSWIKLNYSMRFTREDYERPSAMTNSLYRDLARQGWPTLPLKDPNGYYYSSPSPALGLAEGGRDQSQTDLLAQQIALLLEPVKNWVTHFEFNYQTKSQDRHWDTQKTYNHDVNGNPYLYGTSSGVHEGFYKENYWNLNVFTEYNLSLAEEHNFKLMGGVQLEKMATKSFGVDKQGIIVPGLPNLDLTSGLGADGKEATPGVYGNTYAWSTAGFFGRLNYDYKGRYLLEANVRYDGTSRFRRDNRWNIFSSFSVGWNIARENFWKSFEKTVGTLKIRASYGELGNQNTKNWYPTYQTMGVYSANGSWLQNGTKPNTAYAPGLISSSLTWERVKSWNLGVDFGAFDNRLAGSFDLYSRKTIDMIGPAPELPVTLGTGVPKANNTDLNTYGWEFSIGWNDRLSNGLGYGVRFMLSDAQTKITRYPNKTKNLSYYREGQKMGDIWGYETVGLAKSTEEMSSHLSSLPNGGQNALGSNWLAGDIMYRDLNDDGKIDSGKNTEEDHGDLKLIGNNTSRFLFSLDLTADWKGFDIRAFFQGVGKRDYWQGSNYFWGASGSMWWSTGLVEHADYFRGTTSNDLPANINSYYPRPIFDTWKNLQTQTRYLQDASYIRLKNCQIGYTIPAHLTQKAKISKLRLFFSGENLWTGTSLAKMFDPETVDGGDNNGNAYPLQKTMSLGLSVTF